MAKITFKGNPINTSGDLPKVGSAAKDFKLVKTDLSEVSLASYAGKKKVLNIFPSIDTATCATSVRQFNSKAADLKNTVVLCVSADASMIIVLVAANCEPSIIIVLLDTVASLVVSL